MDEKKRARSDACRPVARSVSSNAVISGPDLGKELSGKLCRITGYNDFVGPPPSAGQRKKKADAQAKAMRKIKSMEDIKALRERRFTYGEDERKYGVDLWYGPEPDGTGCMRMWDKYFELVWNDNEISYYNVSGRNIISIGVGTILGDKGGIAQTRLFKDDLNPVPPRPKELGGK